MKLIWKLIVGSVFIMGVIVAMTSFHYWDGRAPAGENNMGTDKLEKVHRIKDYLPYGQTLDEGDLKKWLAQEQDPIQYTGPALLSFPIIPLQFFAVRYEEDIVIETNHPFWSMHEFARIKVNGKDHWVAKDSGPDGMQTISSDIENINRWGADVPLPRNPAPVNVIDRSTEDFLDVELRYMNPKQENTHVHFTSPRPAAKNPLSNGSTFNHSSQFVSALLDIPGKQLFGTKASVTYDGHDYGIRKVMKLVPVKVLLNQTQGGMAAANFQQSDIGNGRFKLSRPIPGTQWNTEEEQFWESKQKTYSTRNGMSRWEYDFENDELTGARVFVDGETKPLLSFLLSDSLPNFSRPFSGEVRRNFAIQINGKNQGHGYIVARQDSHGNSQIGVIPLKPFWFSSRPVNSRIKVDPDSATVDVLSEVHFLAR